jgi:type VI secretion system protein ImpA
MDCIDLKQLLSTHSEEHPSGDDLEYDPLFGEMERAAKGKEERQFGDTLIAAEEPDWAALKIHALDILARSKDLRAAIHLTRAMIHTHGYAGLAAGLSLIKGYIEGFWESLYPQLDPDDEHDPTMRINILLNLCDPIEFLVPIAMLPLVTSKRMGQFSYRDIQLASGAVPTTGNEQRTISPEQIDAAFREADTTLTQATHSLIRQSIDAIIRISDSVNEKLGATPSFDLQPLGNLLKAADRELANRNWSGNLADEKVADHDGGIDPISPSPRDNAPTGAINNRDDVIQILDRICHYYARHEPSSPVPLLLQRAKRLVTMGFHEIVQDLAPDGQSHFDFLWRQGDG